jgi:hypothetical protein
MYLGTYVPTSLLKRKVVIQMIETGLTAWVDSRSKPYQKNLAAEWNICSI